MTEFGLLERARLHAALGDESRLAIVEALIASDLAPVELRRRLGMESNLLAHHIDVLERVALVRRVTSSGDHRRRYLQLIPETLKGLALSGEIAPHQVLFVCTENSARSQMAAALWNAETEGYAESAGTRPAAQVHPQARKAAARHGLDLSTARPRSLSEVQMAPELVVTVCDRAHEELANAANGTTAGVAMVHWSIPDPAAEGTARAFTRAFQTLRERIVAIAPAAN